MELVKIREELLKELSGYGFDYVTLDLAGFRSGSMDIHIEQARKEYSNENS